MKLRCMILMMLWALAACTAAEVATPVVELQSPTSTATPTHTPRPRPTLPPESATATTTPTVGTVWGKVCYPSSETPPMTLYFQNITQNETVELEVERGQASYRLDLPPADYIAYALTVGMGLRGIYSCAGSEEPCPFSVKPGQTTRIDLCGWDSAPGLKPSEAGQPEEATTVKLLQNMFARTGPHLSYPELGLVKAGSRLPAVGRTVNNEWLLVKQPALNVTGWLHAPLMQVSGKFELLPVTAEPALRDFGVRQFVPAIWRSEYHQGIVLFKGEIRDQAGQPVNGYSILLDNGTWSVLSHPTGASHHYPDVGDGQWDVVIDNETDAAGWWTMTVVRYECPHFEKGFDAQCKRFSPLSETKVIKVIHPDENIIEANWTCLATCNRGVYIKAYRKPVRPLPGNFLLYSHDRALKSAPPSPVFERNEMKTIYDSLPETEDGLKAYLADNRPARSPDGQYLLINGPAGVTWLAELATGSLREISRPGVAGAWGPDSRQIAYVKDEALYIYDLARHEARPIWQKAGLSEAVVTWPDWIVVATGMESWRISPTGQGAVKLEAGPEIMPATVRELIEQKLPPGSTWALSHDQKKVAFSLQAGGPLRHVIFIFEVETKTQFLVGPINGYRVAEIRWAAGDDLLVIGATNPKFPSGGALFTFEIESKILPEIWLESDTAYLVDILPELP